MLDKYTIKRRKVILLIMVTSLAASIMYTISCGNPLVKMNGYVKRKFDWCGAAKNITLQELFSVVPVSSTNVFLIWPRENPQLLYRYLCAAESWAFHHPNASIWFIFTVNVLEDPGESAKLLLEAYPNIQYVYTDVDKLMKDTPLYNLTKQKIWESSRSVWQATHMADFLRQAILWHKGGYYSDTDIYPVTSLWHKRNFISTSTSMLDPALMHFDHHHPYTMAVMETIANTFNPNDYLTAAPHATITAMVTKCGESYGKDIGSQERTCTIDGHNTTFLRMNNSPYPGHLAFKPRKGRIYDKLVKNGALIMNLVNSGSRHIPSQFGVQSIINEIGKRNCPFIYLRAQKQSHYW